MPDDKRYFMKTCPARPGDYVELLAEIDLLMAISLCPGGDLAVPIWGEGSDAEPNCNPLSRRGVRARSRICSSGWEPARPRRLPRCDRAPSWVRRARRSAATAHRARSGHGLGRTAMGVLLGIAAGILLGVSDFMANRASRTISSASVSRTNLAVSGLIAPLLLFVKPVEWTAQRHRHRRAVGHHPVGWPGDAVSRLHGGADGNRGAHGVGAAGRRARVCATWSRGTRRAPSRRAGWCSGSSRWC